ncbi:MAG: hypothetical protein P8Y92_17060 [Halioglobus sp.]
MNAETAPRGARHLACLVALFLLALLPRLYSAQTLGWNWDGPGSFTLVNFDEGGSCRAALDGFSYSTFVGRQTIGLAAALGDAPPAGIKGNAPAVKAWCHSPRHILVARSYSAVTGALTVVLLAIMALQLVPAQPAVAWTAGALLALSGFHISESQSGTVDAPSVFFIYAFLAMMVFAVRRASLSALLASPLLLVPALWAKYWVFAIFAYTTLLPRRVWDYVTTGLDPWRMALLVLATGVLFGLATNPAFEVTRRFPLLALYYLLVPWRRIRGPMIAFWLLVPVLAWLVTRVDIIAAYTGGGMTGRFGSGYGAIGWHKWLRNLLNLPVVLLVGLSLPACLFIPAGIRALTRKDLRARPWLCVLVPLAVFALYMAFLAPVTYYRHYLALLPGAALLSALGLHSTQWGRRRWFVALFLLWPALLAVDLVADYHRDPRIELRAWYDRHPRARVLTSFYVNTPRQYAHNSRLFRPEYAAGDAIPLRRADYLILSENWYDTAFANELNGPLTGDLSRLVKTTPAYARFYRTALAGAHPRLRPEEALNVRNFMPELILHRRFYGTFQLFVGDIRIFRVVD